MEKQAALLIFMLVAAVAVVGLLTEPSVVGDWHFFKKMNTRHYQPQPLPPQRPFQQEQISDANKAILAQQMGQASPMLIQQQQQAKLQEEQRQRMRI